jgi:hypothetical protein
VRVSWGCGKTNTSEDFEVGLVITDVGNFSVGESMALFDCFVDHPLVLGTLHHFIKAEFPGSSRDNLGRPPGDDPDAATVRAKRNYAEAIANMEGFCFPPIVGVRDSAIRQDAVNIEKEKRDRTKGRAI